MSTTPCAMGTGVCVMGTAENSACGFEGLIEGLAYYFWYPMPVSVFDGLPSAPIFDCPRLYLRCYDIQPVPLVEGIPPFALGAHLAVLRFLFLTLVGFALCRLLIRLGIQLEL